MSGVILQFPTQLTDIRSQVFSFSAIFCTPYKIVGGTFQTSIELNDGITTADGLTPGSGSGMVTIASATTPEPSCWGQRSCLVPASFVSVARPTG